MRDAGWDYTPYVPADRYAVPVGAGLTRRQFAERYGFGISATVTQASPSADNIDPNDAYFSGLSASQQSSYTISRDGASAGGTGLPPLERRGCYGKSELAIEDPITAEDRAFLALMDQRFNALADRVNGDARVSRALQQYASCMGSLGYGKIHSPSEAVGAVDQVFRQAIPVGTVSSPPVVDAQQLADVSAFELSIAKADLECGTDLLRVSIQVRIELESAFVDENASDVARFGAIQRAGFGSQGS